MNVKTNCSLKDTTILRKLILENPDLPLLVFVGEDSWSGETQYTQAITSEGIIEHFTLFNDEVWLDEEEYIEKLTDILCDEEKYKNMSSDEFENAINKIVDNTEFVKAIVIYCT